MECFKALTHWHNKFHFTKMYYLDFPGLKIVDWPLCCLSTEDIISLCITIHCSSRNHLQGPVLWLTAFVTCCLWCLHSIWKSQLFFQPNSLGAWEAVVHGSSGWALLPTWETRMELQAFGPGHLGSEPEDRSPFRSLFNSAFQIKSFKFKQFLICP